MTLVSSKTTFFYKRILPKLWFGGIALFFLSALSFSSGGRYPWPFIIGPLIMGGIGYVLMRPLIFDLIDEAYDTGDGLLLKKDGQEELVRFSDIVDVRYLNTNPPRLTLTLKHLSKFGTKVTFSPPAARIASRKHPLTVELISRINSARGIEGSSCADGKTNRPLVLGILGGTVIVTLGAAFWIVLALVKSSHLYVNSVAQARNNAQVKEALGEPIEESWFLQGSFKSDTRGADAVFSVKLSGPKDAGRLHVTASAPPDGNWRYSELQVRTEKGGRLIDLRQAQDK